MNAKILQMQSKKAKLFKLKKGQDSTGAVPHEVYGHITGKCGG